MALILNIDTAAETAYVCIANNGIVLAEIHNKVQKKHASFLHMSIREILKKANIKITNIDSIAIVAGPGSYTGLRVGMATAKGLCYILKKPMVILNLLEVMTYAVISSALTEVKFSEFLFCPLIDARRNEVFTAVYDRNLNEILSTRNLILEKDFLTDDLFKRETVFFGTGLHKLNTQWLDSHKHIFKNFPYNCNHISHLSFKKSIPVSNISLSEPNYFKDFYNV